MSYTQSVYDLLNADAPLLALLTGGLYLGRDVPEEGINREDYPAAYDSNGMLQPIAVVRGRRVIPDTSFRVPEAQYVAVSQVVEIWFYDDKDAGWDTLDSAAQVVYELLQDQQIAEAYNCLLVNTIEEERDPDLGGACMTRLDFSIAGRKQPA